MAGRRRHGLQHQHRLMAWSRVLSPRPRPRPTSTWSALSRENREERWIRVLHSPPGDQPANEVGAAGRCGWEGGRCLPHLHIRPRRLQVALLVRRHPTHDGGSGASSTQEGSRGAALGMRDRVGAAETRAQEARKNWDGE